MRPGRNHRAGIAGAVCAALALSIAPSAVRANEIATAQGPIAIHEPQAGMRSPNCSELIVEARDGLDNHLIGITHPEIADDGTCRYAISVPAQSAVWIHLRPALVAGARSDAAAESLGSAMPSSSRHFTGRGVQLRWTVISPSTYFFAPGEQKTVPLTY